MAGRLGVSIHRLYAGQRQRQQPAAARRTETDHAAELRRVKAELRRVTEARDILKKAATYVAKLSG